MMLKDRQKTELAMNLEPTLARRQFEGDREGTLAQAAA
jgi:hypothetical protein